MKDLPATESSWLLTELFDKMMDRLHCQADTFDATRADNMSTIDGTQDATPEQMMYRLLDLQQLTNPLLTTENGQIRQLRLRWSE